MQCEARLVSALCKVFAEEAPQPESLPPLTVLQAEVGSFQVACHWPQQQNRWVKVSVDTPLAPWCGVRAVKLSPSAYPCHWTTDDNYLRTMPGMYPDRLEALNDGRFLLVGNQWRALWVDVETDEGTPAGVFPITVSAQDEAGETVFSVSTTIEVIGCVLPKGSIYHTEWFHADCLADYYGVSPDSDAFFGLVEPFIRLAVKRGINTILTPLFTPPLDTAVGGERTTVQLVGVARSGGAYTFDFTRLEKWVALCEACGVETYEMSHLFSQWGARYAPKVMGKEDGVLRRLFGWDTPGTGKAYASFLGQFLPALYTKLTALGIADRSLFHISDEPGVKDLENYQKAKAVVRESLPQVRIIDAMSDFSLYQTGAVEIPVVANNHIDPFLTADVPELWTYYCTGQSIDVSNRFFAMPLPRTRILGVQLYLYNIKGFLHWGYNFYNAQYSVERINPYAVTDAGEAFPSGDPFIVYPGKDGLPEESIRLMAMAQAFADVRALTLLEALIGRQAVVDMIYEGIEAPITFDAYPKDASYLLSLRDRVNRRIAQGSQAQ